LDEVNRRAGHKELTALQRDVESRLKDIRNLQFAEQQKSTRRDELSLQTLGAIKLDGARMNEKYNALVDELNGRAGRDELTALQRDVEARLKNIRNLQVAEQENSVRRNELSLQMLETVKIDGGRLSEKYNALVDDLNGRAGRNELTALKADVAARLNDIRSLQVAEQEKSVRRDELSLQTMEAIKIDGARLNEKYNALVDDLNGRAGRNELTALQTDVEVRLKEIHSLHVAEQDKSVRRDDLDALREYIFQRIDVFR
jgi:uncharacterized protein YoxC